MHMYLGRGQTCHVSTRAAPAAPPRVRKSSRHTPAPVRARMYVCARACACARARVCRARVCRARVCVCVRGVAPDARTSLEDEEARMRRHGSQQKVHLRLGSREDVVERHL